MKSKGLVIAGTVLIIISLVFIAYFAPIYNQANINAGDFEISGVDPDQAVPLIIFIVIFFTGVGLLVKGFIYCN
jgi:hypothetical protein